MTIKKTPKQEEENMIVEIEDDELEQVSGGVLIYERSEENIRKTLDKDTGNIVLPEI